MSPFALTFSLLITLAVLFQPASATGGHEKQAAMGGRFPGRLPAAMRLGAVLQAALLLALAAVVLVRGGVLASLWHPASRKDIWFVVACSAVSAAA